MAVPTMTVAELKALQDAKKDFVLVDVREQEEYDTCRIAGSVLIPLRTLPSALATLPKDKPIVVHCHHGGRSAQAVGFLNAQGYTATNLAGGIDAWSEEIDQSVPRY